MMRAVRITRRCSLHLTRIGRHNDAKKGIIQPPISGAHRGKRGSEHVKAFTTACGKQASLYWRRGTPGEASRTSRSLNATR